MLHAMKKARIVLIFVALGFAAFGIVGLVAPQTLVGAVDITTETAQARTEIRAMYGGMQLGFALFLFISATIRPWMRPALVLVVFCVSGLACSRLLGIQLEGDAFPWMLPLALIELSIAAVCLWAWTALRNDDPV